MSRVLPGGLIALILLSCAQPPPPGPRPLSGPPADLTLLQGEWIGTYHSYVSHGRSGAVLFRLDELDGDEVTGCILLRVAGRETAEALPWEGDLWGHVPPERLNSITFTRGADGMVVGTMANYRDPLCGCEMRTVFTGRMRGNILEGTYVSEHANGAERHTGRWRVTRRTVVA
jgi:hypothetical protein